MGVGDFLLKYSNPSFYQAKMTNMASYYKPIVRSGSVTPLWHLFVFTGLTMVTAKYLAYGHIGAAASRDEKEKALAEYREKHGHVGHH
mmetsp:Transcript_22547/g.28914  ORF Transcript_22547/g.28914 Transcript_22547/m.28914 type:complete len:88 (-) Transcript_22547:170-433(-)|eukprot:CAMPEP_0116062030 /NCGR_PEP_ID=MMETSP0322-20121206/7467_1 /TAXON_ID=163516 /ORGANISM="Leptocylindrus danicus var. apora, Strain B651" /LENGTH=87 /DNA_ID=CAMNT_0003547161 /DNA_START=47 /DNA_END=310 /DNA_ORIENTATION=+